MRLSQSLGAFHLPYENDISPLYVFFEVENLGRDAVRISRLYVAPKGDPAPLYEGPFEASGAPLPGTLPAGEATRLWVRAKTLARMSKESGYGGRPRLRLVAEAGSGDLYETTFGFRTDEYLALKDQ